MFLTKGTTKSFLRSANVSEDINDRSTLERVIPTEPMLKTVWAVNAALLGRSRDSAISIVGPCGSGKSTTAIVLVGFLQGFLPSHLRTELKKNGISQMVRGRTPDILVIEGERRSLGECLTDKFGEVFGDIEGGIISKIKSELGKDPARRFVLIIDEFGKFLEYAADYPEEGDVHVLQNMAELAHRSEGRFVLITIRHQALNAYVRRLRGQDLEEWKKIQGRFFDIVHATSLGETLRILNAALNEVHPDRIQTPLPIINTLKNNPLVGPSLVAETLTDTYPVHPYGVLVLTSVFKRLAQNERSIFSFLATSEPQGLRDFVGRKMSSISFEIANLYDYLEHNLRYTILESDVASMWSMIDCSLSLFESNVLTSGFTLEVEHAKRLIKTIGMIDLFGAEVGLLNTKSVLSNAVYGDFTHSETRDSGNLLRILEERSILTFRRSNQTFHLWQGSDINIERLILTEVDKISTGFDYAGMLNRYFRQPPLAARKLHIELGTFRYVTWQYGDPQDLPDLSHMEGDGTIMCIVADKADREPLGEQFRRLDLPDNAIVLLLELSKRHREAIKTYTAIRNLLEEHQPLVKDRIARREIQELELQYKQKLETFFQGPYRGPMSIEYLDTHHKWKRISWDDVGKLVSKRLQRHFKYTPAINNELINTDIPSPSAMVGLKTLVRAMIESPDKRQLGIRSYGPEYSIYLNVLERTGIHREENGKFGFHEPNGGDRALKIVWDYLTLQIETAALDRARVSLMDLENSLIIAPYGLKRGAAKLLVFSNVFSRLANICMYEKESFVPRIYRDTLDRMLKLPQNFSLQYVETNGVHQYLTKRIYEIVKNETKETVTLVDAVTPLVQFANRLPCYTKNTRSLSPRSRTMLQVLLTATQPEELIYTQLPSALGIPRVSGDSSRRALNTYLSIFEESYEELRNARDELIRRCFVHLVKTWNLANKDIVSIRVLLRKRIHSVKALMTDGRLKAFASRVVDEASSHDQWLLSVASLLANKPIDDWTDSDESLYVSELKLRFLQIEELRPYARLYALSRGKLSCRTEKLAKQFIEFLENVEGTNEDKLVALGRVYDKFYKERNVES